MTISLRDPSHFLFAENITIGGSKLTFCHWLYGARFSKPSLLPLESHPMGRGTVHDLNGENRRGHFSDFGEQINLHSIYFALF